MKNDVILVRYSKEEISLLKDLWIELNNYHIPVVTTFKERFRNVSFENHLNYLIRYKTLFAYVATEKEERIGFVIVFALGDTAEIDSIYVKEGYRHLGIGNMLIKNALKELIGNYKEIVIKVAEGNEQPFHSSNHFKKRYTLYQYDYNDTE